MPLGVHPLYTKRWLAHGQDRAKKEANVKEGIHPKLVPARIICGCGNVIETYSTKPEIYVEVCSKCHPFYTGQQRFVDTEGRVERFQRRMERASR